jgi:hypothetical protein
MKKADANAINGVRRKINEIMKKTDEKIVVGWRPDYVKRQEGDIWKDGDGKEWTVRNGVIQNITKLDSAKMPWFCPSCDKIMNHRLDTRYWRMRGKCMDCVISDETKIRAEGSWAEYEQEIMRNNYVDSLKEYIAYLVDLKETIAAPEVLLADDTNILMTEKWHVDIDKVKNDIQADIDYHAELLRKFEAGETDEREEEQDTQDT